MTDILFAYGRREAIRDGQLIDVTDAAEQAGYLMAVAMTRAVWRRYVQVPPGVGWQEEQVRLSEMLWVLRRTIEAKRPADCILRFQLQVPNDNRHPKPVTLKAVCGPDDDLRPVITIMLPGEG